MWKTGDNSNNKVFTNSRGFLIGTPETPMNQHNLNIMNNNSTIQYTRETQMTNVASQTSPSKGIQPQNHVIATIQPQEMKKGTNQHLPSADPIVVLPISKNQKNILWLLSWGCHHSPSHDNNPTNLGKVGEKWTDQWVVSPSNLYGGHETKTRNALRASGFRE